MLQQTAEQTAFFVRWCVFNEANRRRRFALCPELNERFGESEANVAVNKNIYASHEVLVLPACRPRIVNEGDVLAFASKSWYLITYCDLKARTSNVTIHFNPGPNENFFELNDHHIHQTSIEANHCSLQWPRRPLKWRSQIQIWVQLTYIHHM